MGNFFSHGPPSRTILPRGIKIWLIYGPYHVPKMEHKIGWLVGWRKQLFFAHMCLARVEWVWVVELLHSLPLPFRICSIAQLSEMSELAQYWLLCLQWYVLVVSNQRAHLGTSYWLKSSTKRPKLMAHIGWWRQVTYFIESPRLKPRQNGHNSMTLGTSLEDALFAIGRTADSGDVNLGMNVAQEGTFITRSMYGRVRT